MLDSVFRTHCEQIVARKFVMENAQVRNGKQCVAHFAVFAADNLSQLKCGFKFIKSVIHINQSNYAALLINHPFCICVKRHVSWR